MTSETTETGARTLDRGLAVLEAVLLGAGRLDDVCAATGLSRSATQRFLATLTQRGYLEKSSAGWTAGLRLVELAGESLAQSDPGARLAAELDALARKVEDVVHVGVLSGDDIVYVAKAQGARALALVSRVGLRLPAQNTALGRVLNALGDVEGAVSRFREDLMQTDRSVRTAQEYREILLETGRRGYGLDDEESMRGLTCVGVPLLDPRGEAFSAVSVSTPTVYMTPERFEHVLTTLRDAAPRLATLVRVSGVVGVARAAAGQ